MDYRLIREILKENYALVKRIANVLSLRNVRVVLRQEFRRRR